MRKVLVILLLIFIGGLLVAIHKVYASPSADFANPYSFPDYTPVSDFFNSGSPTRDTITRYFAPTIPDCYYYLTQFRGKQYLREDCQVTTLTCSDIQPATNTNGQYQTINVSKKTIKRY